MPEKETIPVDATAPDPEVDFGVLERSTEEIAEPSPAEVKGGIVYGKALEQFEAEILHGPLPPEAKQRVIDLRDAKNQESANQAEQLADLNEEMKTGLLGRRIERGKLTIPSIVEEYKEALALTLNDALAKYLETPAGQRDAEIGQLRRLLGGKINDPAEIAQVGKRLGIKSSAIKHLIPGQKDKSRQSVFETAERRLNELARPGVGWDERPKGWQDELKSEKANADYLATDIIRNSRIDLSVAVTAFEHDWRYVNESSQPTKYNLPNLRAGVGSLENAAQSSAVMLQNLAPQNVELLSQMARGNFSPDQVVNLLAAKEHRQQVNLRGIFEKVILDHWMACSNRLAEPSLVGLSLGEDELVAVQNNLHAIYQLAEAYGVRPDYDLEYTKKQIAQDIADAQRFFFERIDNENSLYWHFDAQGLKIIESGELRSGAMVGDAGRNTGEWSKGIHFIKPGFGMNSHDHYIGYATTTLNLGTKMKIENPFGVALVYRLGDLTKQTSIRTEPIVDPNKGRANISEDMVFRPQDGSDKYAYDLEDAYIVPMVVRDQLEVLRGDHRFTDLFDQAEPGRSHLLARQVLERALRLAGRSDEWIAQHVVPYWEDIKYPDEEDINNSYYDREKAELELQRSVTHKILSAQSPSHSLIVALSAKKGGPEAIGHIKGSSPQVWTEQLVALNIRV